MVRIMSNSFGQIFRITIFGESYGESIGVVIDGCPPGILIDPKEIEEALKKGEARYLPGITSERTESNEFKIKSGVFNGFSTGAPITLEIANEDLRDSSKYEKRKHTPRPGHSDFTTRLKYGGFNDYRGGGRFSGRVMVAITAAGCIAKKLLLNYANVRIFTFTSQIGSISFQMNEFNEGIFDRDPYNYLSRCPDYEIDRIMVEEILKVKNEGDSIGGIISCYIKGIPTGLGEPLFNNIESNLASGMFSIPGACAIDFGTGFRLAQMKGSEANDQLYYNSRKDRFETKTNHSGGILGGISTGISPITFHLAFKPTPSIYKPQHTVNLKTKENFVMKLGGRFDPCIVPRAVIIVEQLAALVFADLFLLAEVAKPKKF